MIRYNFYIVDFSELIDTYTYIHTCEYNNYSLAFISFEII